MVQTEFVCECCKGQFERFGSAGATCRKRLKQRGYVFCSKSCGGYKHGGFKNRTSEYMSWGAMKDRCNNPNSTAYVRYGGRGITHDPAWTDFEKFLEDMGLKENPKLELERIDNDKGYYKENCRWATHKEQTRNRGGKRATRLYTFNNKTMCIADWAKEVGISPQSMQKRLNKGWDLDRALTPPLNNT
jgi:hypothetical protein